MHPATKLRQLLAEPGIIQAAGIADAGQGRLVESVGYPAAYMSGAYVNHTRGYPDGVLTLSEIAARLGEIVDRISIPVIADADEGFGDVTKIIRTVHEFERAGAAALHIEDMPIKHHGHPMPIEEMRRNLGVVLDTRRNSDLVVIGRTDAMAAWRQKVLPDLDACEKDAFERCLAYADAGADIVMPMYPSIDWIKRYARKIPKPVLFCDWNLPGQPSANEMADYNVKIVVYPTNMLTRTVRFMRQEYAKWLADGAVDSTPQDEQDREAAKVLVGVLETRRALERYR